jgi:hypothetical protein
LSSQNGHHSKRKETPFGRNSTRKLFWGPIGFHIQNVDSMIHSMNHHERIQEATYEENKWPTRVVNQQTGTSQSISALPKGVATIATHKSPGRSRRNIPPQNLHQKLETLRPEFHGSQAWAGTMSKQDATDGNHSNNFVFSIC